MLELRGVDAGYGATTVVRGVDLVVPDGSVVALLGPNGAGKTTLLTVASGLLRPQSGRVLIDHEDVAGRAPERLAASGLCHIQEGRSVFPSLSVADNLRMFAPAGAADAIEMAVTAFPRLGERLNQIAGTMSGGEQQMLSLARAYVTKAPLVMLDEVSMGLAPIIVDEIFVFLRRLADEGHSLLVVEQYVGKALALADLVYLVVRGRVVFAGDPRELEGSDIAAHYLGAEVAEIA